MPQVFPHISVWGSSFLAGIPPASAGPSVLLAPSSVHSLTHSLTHSHSQASAETSSLTHSLIHTTHSITDETAEGPAVSRDCRRACGARGRRWAGSLRSVQRLQKGLRRAWSPLGRLSPQFPETAEGPAARVVAAGPALSTVSRGCMRVCGARGRRWAGSLRSVQRLQKGLRRAWSPLGRLSPQCPETAEGPVARVVAAGPALSAVSRDCRRACGARGRRWAGSLHSVQRLHEGLRRAWSPLGRLSPQCPETAEGPAARVVAAGPALSAVSRDWRAWSPLGRLSPQCPETAEGPAARVVAAGPALSTVSRDCRRACGARGRRWAGSLRSVQRLQKGLRRAWSPLGRLSPQCPETAEEPVARVVAAGPALSAVSRDCRRACGARGRRWAGSLHSVQRLHEGLRRAWSLLGRLSLQWPALSAVSRDCRRACGARGRRWAGSLRSVQRLHEGLRRAWSPLGRLSPQCPEARGRRWAGSPQCPETAEGPAARVVAAGPALSAVSRDCRRACGARGRRWAGSLRSVQRLQKGLRRAWSPLGRLSPQCPEAA